MIFNKNSFYHITRIILAFVFIYASIDKIIHPQAFAQAVFNHQVLPETLINIIAIVLPWMELGLGICLLFNVWMNGVSLLTAILMLVFMSTITFNLLRGLDVGCGCFSTSAEGSMNSLTFIRDLIFLCLSFSLVMFVFRKHKKMINTSGVTK
jgi:uncharacterized membrane protein YphA (DoxX/SURF4 family)